MSHGSEGYESLEGDLAGLLALVGDLAARVGDLGERLKKPSRDDFLAGVLLGVLEGVFAMVVGGWWLCVLGFRWVLLLVFQSID
jgi:hypothetical protein